MNFLPKPKPSLHKPKPPLGRNKPRNLAEWLETATWYLVPSAKERIRAEIEAHYIEAVQSHLAGGSTEPAAQAAALADLGNPRSAARRFRREHLTDEDAEAIATSINLARKGGAGTGYCALVLFFAFVWAIAEPLMFWLHPPPGDDFAREFLIGFQILLLVVVILPWRAAARILAGQKTTLALLRQIIFLRTVVFAIFSVQFLSWAIKAALDQSFSASLRDDYLTVHSIFTSVFLDKSLNGHWPVFDFWTRAIASVPGLYLMGMFVRQTLSSLRLRKKLQSADEADLPPSDPTTLDKSLNGPRPFFDFWARAISIAPGLYVMGMPMRQTLNSLRLGKKRPSDDEDDLPPDDPTAA
jgi:hypothetical protein